MLLVADQLGDLLDQLALLTLYGISVATIDLRPVFGCSSTSVRAAHQDRAAAGLVGAADAVAAVDDAAGREVGARDDLASARRVVMSGS